MPGYDLDHTYVDGVVAFAASSGSSLAVTRDTVEATTSLGMSLRKLQVALHDQAVLIAGVDSSGDAWLVHGAPLSGVFTEVPLESGLSGAIIDIDILATSAETLMVALRSASEVAVMGVSLN